MKEMTEEMIKEFQPTGKVGLIATVDENGAPHITILSSLQANAPGQMIMGQFTEGLSKDFMKERPEVGFLIMTLDKRVWTGTARWTHCRNEGKEFDMYNQKPMFRYNSYFGIHTVHYFDLLEISEGENLKMASIIPRAVLNIVGKQFFRKKQVSPALKPWAEKLMKGLQVLKFLSWIADDGFPRILPIIEAQASDSNTIVIPAKPYADSAQNLKQGAAIAVNGFSLEMVGTLVKGRFGGFRKTVFGKSGAMRIESVYNSLPPKPGYIYP